MPPRWALRLGPSPRLLITFPLPILLLFWLFIGTSFGTVIGTKHLYCMTCIRVESDTTALDQFRVRQALTMPMCEMEPVECEPHQDTCVTISMQITHRQFWMGSGCDQRVNYDFPSGGRDGCVEMPAIYRNFHPGFMEERRTLQRVCLCSGNLCNSAVGLHPKCPPLHLPLLLTAIVSALITFWPRLLLPMEL